MHEKQKVCPHSVLLNASTYVSRHIGHACASSSNDNAAPCAATVVITVLSATRAEGMRDGDVTDSNPREGKSAVDVASSRSLFLDFGLCCD